MGRGREVSTALQRSEVCWAGGKGSAAGSRLFDLGSDVGVAPEGWRDVCVCVCAGVCSRFHRALRVTVAARDYRHFPQSFSNLVKSDFH